MPPQIFLRVYLRFRLYRGGGQGRCLRGRGAGHGQQGGKRIATWHILPIFFAGLQCRLRRSQPVNAL
ncbi:MAG: hypothetical protein EBX37_13870 [Alphaproteobacteria bacterium]|nr:hypothetical protein [Alphaproteobacteria bacterium]